MMTKHLNRAWRVAFRFLGILILIIPLLSFATGCGALKLKKSREDKLLHRDYLPGGAVSPAPVEHVEKTPASSEKKRWFNFWNQRNTAPEKNAADANENRELTKRQFAKKEEVKDALAPEEERAAVEQPPGEKKSWWSLFRKDKAIPRPVEQSSPVHVSPVVVDTVPTAESPPEAAAQDSNSRLFGLLLSRDKKDDKSPAGQLTAEELATIDTEMARAAEVVQQKTISVTLRPGLLLDIKVMVAGNNQLEPDAIRISDQGIIFLPMLGAVDVNNMTLDALRDDLTTRYRRFFVNPELLVDFARDSSGQGLSPWGYITVLGRVKNPGRIMIPATRDLTVSGVIQGAGGFDKSARINAIRVTRRNPDGNGQLQFTVNLNEVGSDGKAENDFILGMDDVVFVPESRF